MSRYPVSVFNIAISLLIDLPFKLKPRGTPESDFGPNFFCIFLFFSLFTKICLSNRCNSTFLVASSRVLLPVISFNFFDNLSISLFKYSSSLSSLLLKIPLNVFLNFSAKPADSGAAFLTFPLLKKDSRLTLTFLSNRPIYPPCLFSNFDSIASSCRLNSFLHKLIYIHPRT